MTKLFFLGATGHIGGAVVNAILAQYPDVELTALVRDQNKAQRLEQAFSRTRGVVGDLDDVDLIERESKAAGIVINTSPDQLDGSPAAIRAILRGLAARTERGFYIQTSGAFLVGEEGSGDRASGEVWNDVLDIDRITTMPPDRYHQRTDQLLRDGSSNANIAIVSPTVVYGLSASTENQIPITIRDIIATTRKLSAGFTMSRGRNIMGYVHVNDLADVYVKLVKDAMEGSKSESRLWGSHAYYFANGEEISFAGYMEALVKILRAKGAIPSDSIKEIGTESDAAEREIVNETAVFHGYGTNVRCRSERAATLLGWKPKGPSLRDTLPEVVDLVLSRK
ncbi:hypothetical protein LOCC1_G007688 [Lachnellula occidentalis]|uniref:NAD(P)-binding domain-containing protein n=1 Tax=Lachnellula occidentalis TaxID=215460 RepID=A0A8H8U8C7_9HELO|nr:hypothetical protein LOCC1_G007688 [Lachnellula occidentalis]